ncbi:hypothetical protein BUALT_Bualt13G0038800 [Buddleja alternifolia]|uniref:RNase H type-1 domain-containing protein n=1 Tax=Buddleja alternifolia TaxID=168488 RepID=A0AAV6WRQ5_9LAMI|nr:hypothetical protein BUALT_Bualt13G0038800 [Buddleja alternifolia]
MFLWTLRHDRLLTNLTLMRRDDPEALVEAIQVGWTRPELGWFKLNVDASIQKDHMHQHALVAIGGVVRDMHGRWHGGFAGTVPDSSILAAELKSILQASFLGGAAAAKQLPTTSRRGAVSVRASMDSEKMVVNAEEKSSSNNTRRDLMFAFAAAAACSVAKVAMADEPKRGTPEAKKKYSAVCVTMPTAKICRY